MVQQEGKNIFPAPKKKAGLEKLSGLPPALGEGVPVHGRGLNEIGFKVLSNPNQYRILLTLLVINLPATFTQFQTVIPTLPRGNSLLVLGTETKVA